MKKTNTFKRFAAITSASILAACMVAPMAMTSNVAAEQIQITGISESVEHTFEVYQVFSGTLDAAGKLSDIKWAEGATAYDGVTVNKGDAVSDVIITELTGANDAREFVEKFTLGTKITGEFKSSGTTLNIDNLAPGYYIVKDVTNLDGKDDANSAWIVQVAKNDTTIAIKNGKPTVDKQIWDETGDAESGAIEGWGESADHAINEKFQFKLTATIPADSDLKYYDEYKLVFNDAMSAGVTFDKIDSVKVDGTEITSGYTTSDNAVANAAGITWTLTVDDVKDHIEAGTLGTKEIVVEVVYTAHLNEKCFKSNASVANGDTTNVNNNMVYLEYSNNPDNLGTGDKDLGETEKDYVWAFTYQVNNTKVKEVTGGAPLEGAGFEIRTDEAKKDTAIKLIDNGDGTYTVADQAATEGVVTTMTSDDEGSFDVIGLDAGTYYLVETVTPEGYNTCANTTVVVNATHAENSASKVDMTLSSDSTMDIEVINKAGSTLPGTGGIGTTLFYIGGGAMVAVAGVYLISKKRMNNVEE